MKIYRRLNTDVCECELSDMELDKDSYGAYVGCNCSSCTKKREK